MKCRKVYYAVVEIGDELFGAGDTKEPPRQQIERVCNAAMVVCRDLVALLTVSKSPIPGQDAARLRLIQHAQEVVDLVREVGRAEQTAGVA